MTENVRYRWIKEARDKETPPSSAPLVSPRSPKHSIQGLSFLAMSLLLAQQLGMHATFPDGPDDARALAAALAGLNGLTTEARITS